LVWIVVVVVAKDRIVIGKGVGKGEQVS
jgi:hypothetical protein